MNRLVELSIAAASDASEISGWIAERSLAGEAAWLDAFRSALDELEEWADSCPAIADLDLPGRDIRERTFRTRRGRTYRLVFEIRDDTVFVLRVRGPGQDFLTDDDL